jgi:hypothetical protein
VRYTTGEPPDDKVSISKFGGRQGPAVIQDEHGRILLKGIIYSDELSISTIGGGFNSFLRSSPFSKTYSMEVKEQHWTICMRDIKRPAYLMESLHFNSSKLDPVILAMLRQQPNQQFIFHEADLVGQPGETVIATTDANGVVTMKLENNG